MLKLVSLNIALPETVNLGGGNKKCLTGFFKKPITEKIFLSELDFNGDGVGDTRIHGEMDLAVCAYFTGHFSFWEDELNRKIEAGAFGENLSLAGINETQIHIGDKFSLGDAEIEVSQPRQPCHKLNKRFQFQGMACKVQPTGYTGCYFRVKKPGWIKPDFVIKKLCDGDKKISIDMVNILMFKEKKNSDLLKKVVQLDTLSVEWRDKFLKRL